MAASFLPKPFRHHYEIAPEYAKSAVYFSCEFAIDQSFKTYSGGLGFLAGSQTDLRGAASGSVRVVRGGYWSDSAGGCRVAFRYSYGPTGGNSYFGFRIARNSVP